MKRMRVKARDALNTIDVMHSVSLSLSLVSEYCCLNWIRFELVHSLWGLN